MFFRSVLYCPPEMLSRNCVAVMVLNWVAWAMATGSLVSVALSANAGVAAGRQRAAVSAQAMMERAFAACGHVCSLPRVEARQHTYFVSYRVAGRFCCTTYMSGRVGAVMVQGGVTLSRHPRLAACCCLVLLPGLSPAAPSAESSSGCRVPASSRLRSMPCR